MPKNTERFTKEPFPKIRRATIGVLRAGTVMVTSANMVGKGAAWGLPIATHTLNITLGGIIEKIIEKNGRFEKREHLCLTLSFDHDIIDGAPAARFVRKLKNIISACEPVNI